MKEFVLTQPYATIEEMLSSGEVAVYKEELEQGNIEKYAIVSRIGNRYDFNGKKIEGFVDNPYFKKKEESVVDDAKIENALAELANENKTEERNMKYYEIEALIDKEIETAVAEVKAEYELKISTYEYDIGVRETEHAEEIAKLKEQHAKELANLKYEVKAELLAKLNS